MLTRFTTKLVVVGVALSFLTNTTLADWNVGDPAKYVQMPDLSTTGMDINATAEPNPLGLPILPVLADDFPCTSTDPITDIHIWGSWFNDLLPQVFSPDGSQLVPDPGSVRFNLSIHADIPASQNPLGYSMPGELLWSKVFEPGEFTVRPWAQDLQEGWLDPISGQFVFPGDTVAWQYNFLIPEDEAFVQQGTATKPVVYWLNVAAMPINEGQVPAQPLFGWKTSVDHFNDVAVVGPTDILQWPNPTHWQPIENATTFPVDMAFVITPEPASLAILGLGLLSLVRRR